MLRWFSEKLSFFNPFCDEKQDFPDTQQCTPPPVNQNFVGPAPLTRFRLRVTDCLGQSLLHLPSAELSHRESFESPSSTGATSSRKRSYNSVQPSEEKDFQVKRCKLDSSGISKGFRILQQRGKTDIVSSVKATFSGVADLLNVSHLRSRAVMLSDEKDKPFTDLADQVFPQVCEPLKDNLNEPSSRVELNIDKLKTSSRTVKCLKQNSTDCHSKAIAPFVKQRNAHDQSTNSQQRSVLGACLSATLINPVLLHASQTSKKQQHLTVQEHMKKEEKERYKQLLLHLIPPEYQKRITSSSQTRACTTVGDRQRDSQSSVKQLTNGKPATVKCCKQTVLRQGKGEGWSFFSGDGSEVWSKPKPPKVNQSVLTEKDAHPLKNITVRWSIPHSSVNLNEKRKENPAAKHFKGHKVGTDLSQKLGNDLSQEVAIRLSMRDVHLGNALERATDAKTEFGLGSAEECPTLTKEIKREIQKALEPGEPDEVLSTAFKLKITRSDIGTLRNSNWLNDEVINFYMNLIMERSKKPEFPDTYAFSTFFFTKLSLEGYQAVKRWTKGVDIFEKEIILVPLHLGVHWALIVIDCRRKTIRYLDSMAKRSTSACYLLQQYLDEESKAKKGQALNVSEWTVYTMKSQEIPQQMNGSDCGVFLCKYADYLSRDRPLTFTQRNMPYFRKTMVWEILHQRLLCDVLCSKT